MSAFVNQHERQKRCPKNAVVLLYFLNARKHWRISSIEPGRERQRTLMLQLCNSRRGVLRGLISNLSMTHC